MTDAIVQQWLVAGSTLLAALPVGCAVGYPGVLLQQLKSNDSSIQMDWDTSTWIGSIHGIAGVPSLLMPVFMQWRGRKIAFVLACLISITGWIVAFTATTTTSVLISECLHGFSSESILSIGLLSMSEMVSPQIRTITLSLYVVTQTLGMALVGIMGGYLHWRTMTLVICAPLVVVTVIATCMWPESPAWLAYKGKFDKCKIAFTRLRGTGELAITELEELILAQKENLSRNIRSKEQSLLASFCQTLRSRDFYLPAVHMYLLFNSVHWTGTLVFMIYSAEIVQRATQMKEAVPLGVMILNILMFVGCFTSIILIRYFQPKKILVMSISGAVLCLLGASVVNITQTVGLMNKESYICLYIIYCFMYIICLGLPMLVTITAELMPVKHRGVGGPLYIICTCVLHSSALKLAPYLFEYMNMWGSWLLYVANGTISSILIWKYVPETKGKTLQQLEDYYAYGNINKSRRNNDQESLSGLTGGGERP